MVRRQAILGLVAIALGGGCHAGTSGGLKKADPPLAKETISKARIIAQHNKNAATIQSLKASPSIVVNGDGQHARLSGQIAMERPKDFRLDIRFHGRPQADIGSNAKGFWFWVKDSQEKAIYVCNHDEVNSSPLAVTMQPDWILEAMGLREISEREAQTISASPGDKAGQLTLTQLRKDPKGEALTKVTIVNEATGEILEHRLYSGAKEKLLARATISQTQGVQMEATDDDPSGSLVTFPAKIKLEWLVENFSLDMTMSDIKINPQFPEKTKLALFSRPEIAGAAIKDLARLDGGPSATSSRIYESAPRGVQLGRPQAESTGVEGASYSPRQANSVAGGLANAPIEPDTYVGPQLPKGVDPEAVQASSRGGFGRGTFQRQ